MRCILHIGTEKTGTTTLQEFFIHNKKLFLKQNFKITKSLGEINNSGLVQIANKDLLSSHVKTVRGMDDASYELFLKDRIQSFKEELFTTKWPSAGENKNVLLSSEFLQSYLNIKDIKNLRANLLKLGFEEFKIVLVLRPQSEVVLSRISTGVIAGHHYKFLTNKNIIQLPKNFMRNSLLYNYKETIDNWCEIFGSNNLTILDFNKIKKPSLETNFLKAIDSNFDTKGLKKAEIKNTSLPFKIILSLNKFNKNYKIKHSERRKLITKIRTIKSEKINYALCEQSLKQINSHFGPENEEIQDRYKIDLKNKYRKLGLLELNIEDDYQRIINLYKKSNEN